MTRAERVNKAAHCLVMAIGHRSNSAIIDYPGECPNITA